MLWRLAETGPYMSLVTRSNVYHLLALCQVYIAVGMMFWEPVLIN